MDLMQALHGGLPGIPSEYIPHDPTSKQLAFLFLPHREAFYGGAAGGGKVLYDDGVILTPFGWKRGIDLCVGDSVCNPDGSHSRVIQIHPRQSYRVWKVSFSDGTSTLVAEEHLWLVWRSGIRKKIQGEISFGEAGAEVVETRTLKKWCDRAKQQEADGKRPNWPCIPVCQPQRFNVSHKWPASLDPYQLGYWLGDGHCGEAVGFTTADHGHFQKQFPGDFRRYGDYQYTARGDIGNYWLEQLSKLGLKGAKAYNKFVPRQYLWANLEDRLSILQGLLDTDGTADVRGQVSFTTTSPQLAEDVRFLVASLGGTATISEKDPFYRGQDGEKVLCRTAYTLYIKHPNEPSLFRLQRKIDRCSIGGNMNRRVISVDVLEGYKTGRCITVSHPNGLYLTNDFIVTHNSDALLMAALQYVDVPGYSAIVFRKTLSDLKLPGSLLDRAHSWLAGCNCKWVGSEHAYYFPTRLPDGSPGEPSKIVFGYIGQEGAKYRYQGSEFCYIGFDELTQHNEEDYVYLFSRLRKVQCLIHKKRDDHGQPIYDSNCKVCQSASKVPLRVRAASNPGGIGHLWVKERFAIQPDITPDGKVRFIGKNPQRPYIPAFLTDNPHLDQEGYDAGLEELDPVTREQLRNGNWDISPDSRFKPNWFRRYSIRGGAFHLGPNGTGDGYTLAQFQKVFFTVDTAASLKEGPGDDKRYRLPNGGSWTVIACWGLTPDYNLLLIDIRRFRKEIPEIPKELKAMYRKWRPQTIGIEAVGTGKGAYQLCLKEGLPVTPIHPHNDKLVRSTDAQVRAEKGRIWLPAHPGPLWLKTYENELFTWSGHPYEVDDQVDVTSYAASMISWEAASGELNHPDNEDVRLYGDSPGVVYVYGNQMTGLY